MCQTFLTFPACRVGSAVCRSTRSGRPGHAELSQIISGVSAVPDIPNVVRIQCHFQIRVVSLCGPSQCFLKSFFFAAFPTLRICFSRNANMGPTHSGCAGFAPLSHSPKQCLVCQQFLPFAICGVCRTIIRYTRFGFAAFAASAKTVFGPWQLTPFRIRIVCAALIRATPVSLTGPRNRLWHRIRSVISLRHSRLFHELSVGQNRSVQLGRPQRLV